MYNKEGIIVDTIGSSIIGKSFDHMDGMLVESKLIPSLKAGNKSSFIFLLPLFLFMYRIIFNKIVCLYIIYPFTSVKVYLYIAFLLCLYVFFLYKVIKGLFYPNYNKKYKNEIIIKINKYLSKIGEFIYNSVQTFRNVLLYVYLFRPYRYIFIKLSAFYRDMLLYLKKNGTKGLKLGYAIRMLFFIHWSLRLILVSITYIPLIIFLVCLYYEVLILNKLEYVYYLTPLFFINTFINFLLEQIHTFFVWFRGYTDDFVKLEDDSFMNLNNMLITLDFSQLNINYDHEDCYFYFLYYSYFYRKQNNYTEDEFENNINNIRAVNFELFNQKIRFLYVHLVHIINTWDVFFWV